MWIIIALTFLEHIKENGRGLFLSFKEGINKPSRLE